MAKRKHKKFRKIDSSEVQGEGSYVIMRAPTFEMLGDLLALATLQDIKPEEAAEIPPEIFEAIFRVIENLVVEWNWVDDEDKPLNQPKDDPDVIRRDTIMTEQLFLAQSINVGELNPKN